MVTPIQSNSQQHVFNSQAEDDNNEDPPIAATQPIEYDFNSSNASQQSRTDSNTYSPPLPELRRTGTGSTSEN